MKFYFITSFFFMYNTSKITKHMIKVLSNYPYSSSTPKISVSCKAVYGNPPFYLFYNSNSVSGAPNYYEIGVNWFLFIKFSFADLSSTSDISRTILHMICPSVAATNSLKVYLVPSLTAFPSTARELYNALDLSSANLIEQIVLKSTSDISGNDAQTDFDIDLSKVTSSINSSNPDFIIALVSDSPENSKLKIYDPAQLANLTNEIFSVSSTFEGINPLNKYFECSCSSLDKGCVNLASGEVIHLFDCLRTSGNKMPISISIAHNSKSLPIGLCFNNRLNLSFEYYIGKVSGVYYVTDYTGRKKAYYHISRPNDDIDYDDLGIKHLDNDGELYYCYEDCSYMYVDNDTSFEIYDRADNYMLLNKTLIFTKLSKIRNSFGEEITFNWTNLSLSTYRVTSITNSYGESVSLSYDSQNSYYLSSINYTNEHRLIMFSSSSNGLSIAFYNTEQTALLYRELDITFSDNCVVSIEEKNSTNESMGKLAYDYSSDKVSLVSNYDYYNNLVNQTSFNYYDGYTKTTDFESNSLYYYFDKFGRARTILDNKGRTESFNYDEITDGVAKGITGQSNIQCNSRNLLENHSFEYIDNNDNLLSWEKTGSGSSELSNDGLFGGKCLHISGSSSVTLSQTIDGILSGDYKLKIRAKASSISSCTVRAAVSYVTTSIVSLRPLVIEEIPHLDNYDITNIISSSSWEEYSTTSISILTNVMKKLKITVSIISGGNNDVYFDDFQLSNTDQITRYNLVENGYLESKDTDSLPIGWTCSGLASNDKIASLSSGDEHSIISGSSVMKLTSIDVNRVSTSFAERILSRDINVSGKKDDEFSFSVWAKCYATLNVKLQAFITFEYENIDSKTYYFDFEKNLASWQLLSRSVLSEDDYSSISIGIIYNGGSLAYFDAFQLCKDSYGTYYNYDRWGNLVESIFSSGNSSRIVNDGRRPKSIVLQDGSHYVYHYNSSGRLTGVDDLNNTAVTFVYSNSGNITNTIIEHGEDTISNSFSYDSSDNLVSKTDEFNNQTSFTYDTLRRVSSIIHPTNNGGFKETYEYDSVSNLTGVSGYNNPQGTVPNYQNEMSYHSRLDTVSTITSLNGTEYTFAYDSAGRLLSVSSENHIIQSFTYNEITGGVNRNLISTKKYGDNGDIFAFTYDNQDRLIEVELNSNTLYQYEYNEFSQLSVSKDLTNGINRYYSYDLKGQLIKVKTDTLTFKYEYDNLGNVQKKTFASGSTNFAQIHDHEYEFNDYSKQGFLSRLGNNYADEVILSDYHGIGEYGLRPKRITCGYVTDSELHSSLFSFTDTTKYIWYNLSQTNSNRTSGVINGKAFSLSEWKTKFSSSKTIYFWFKPTRTSSGGINLFKLKNSLIWSFTPSLSPSLSVNIDSNDKIELLNSSNVIKITTSNSVNYDEWNFLCLKFYRSESQNKVSIRLNSTSSSEVEISESPSFLNSLFISLQTSTPIIPPIDPIGDEYSMPISFEASLIGISNRQYSNSELSAINNAWQKYFVNQEENTLKVSSSTYYNYDIFANFDHVSLNDEAKSKNGLEPLNYVKKHIAFDKEKESIFKYDTDLMRKVYAKSNDGFAPLSYNLPLTQDGTFSIFFKVKSASSYPNLRLIFAFYSGNNIVLSAHLDNHNNCIVGYNGSTKTIKTHIPLNEWNNIYYVSQNNSCSIYFNGEQTIISSVNLSNSTLYLGADKNKIIPLYGYLEQMYFSPVGIAYDSNILTHGRPITIGNELDYLSRPISRNIVLPNDTFSSLYTYDKTRISNETILGSETKTYSYDSMGNVTGVSSTSGVNESYTYDKLSRLLSHTHAGQNVEDYIETFTYDSNGNILTRTGRNQLSLTYEYSGDRLTAVKSGGVTIRSITYDSNNVFYPSSMTILGSSKSLTWSGRRLTNIGNDIEYRYNDEGIRIYKSTPLEETTFELEGSNIVVLNKTVNNATYNFAFHYDINGLLASLTYNSKEYFYIRDILGNILGIINDNGEYIIKYDYTAYGEVDKNIIALSGDDLIVATHNPFVYKGYYYDDETGFYYLKSRYYDPTLCRFISIDSPLYLYPTKISGINLYLYCSNNPISFFDPNGNSVVATILAVCGIVAGIGAVLAVVGALSKNDILITIGECLISLAEIVAGITLIIAGVGKQFGMTFLGAGIGSICNGFFSLGTGGSFNSGWVGGQIAGFATLVPIVGIPAGAFLGSVISFGIDNGFENITYRDLIRFGLVAVTAWSLSSFGEIVGIVLGDSLYTSTNAPLQFILSYESSLLDLCTMIIEAFWPGRK